MKVTVEHEGTTVSIEDDVVTIHDWIEVFKNICLAHGFAPEKVNDAFAGWDESDS